MKPRISEGADCYPHVVAKLSPHTRIIECRDAIQWIVQKSEGVDKNGLTRRKSLSYCRTKQGLLRHVPSEHSVPISTLPDRFVSGSKCLPN
jgi:hypothetical protein